MLTKHEKKTVNCDADSLDNMKKNYLTWFTFWHSKSKKFQDVFKQECSEMPLQFWKSIF